MLPYNQHSSLFCQSIIDDENVLLTSTLVQKVRAGAVIIKLFGVTFSHTFSKLDHFIVTNILSLVPRKDQSYKA